MSVQADKVRARSASGATSGSIIQPGVSIGDDALIGTGSIVTRDAPAGLLPSVKGGSIKRITDPLNPRVCRVVALATPTERERPGQPIPSAAGSGRMVDSPLEGDGFELPVREHRAMAPRHGFGAASHREAALRGARLPCNQPRQLAVTPTSPLTSAPRSR